MALTLAFALALVAPPPPVPRVPSPVTLAMRLCLDEDGDSGVDACRAVLGLKLDVERSAIAYRILAQKLAFLERWPEAADAYRQILKLHPADGETCRRLGQVLFFGLGTADEAVVVLRQAADLSPEDAEVRASLAMALVSLGQNDSAAAAFEDALRIAPGYFETHPAAREVYDACRRGERWP